MVPLQDITPKNVNAITHIEKCNTKSVYNKNKEYTVTRQINEIHVGKLIHAVNSKHPIGIANVINKECLTIVTAFKKLVLQEMDTCVAKLCVRKGNSSVLNNRTNIGLKEFEFDKVWEKMENYHPLLI